MTAHAVAFAVLASTLPLHSQAACKVEAIELPVKMVGSRAVATVGINGTQVPLTVDSGAFYSMLTEAAAAQLKLSLTRDSHLRVRGITGMVDAQTTVVEKLEFLKSDMGRMEFVVGGNEPGAGTMGLLGRNILSLTDTEYDLAHGVIRLVFPNDDCAKTNMAYWAGSSPVTEVDLIDDYRDRLPDLRASIKLNGSRFTAILDTGATTMVSIKAALRANVADADIKTVGNLRGAGRGTATLQTAPFDSFEIGGEVIRNNRLFVGNFDVGSADMLLGVDFFLSHHIYVSKKQSKLFFTYNGGPVFALDARYAAASPGATNPTSTNPASTDPAPGDVAADDARPGTADQLAREGAAAAARRDYASALADLDRAVQLEPASAALLAQRGTIQVVLKHPEKARGDFDRALELDPAQADARLGRVRLRLRAKDRDGAKEDLDALDRSLVPQSPMRLAMTTLYLAAERPAQALAQADQWLEAHPNDMERGVAQNARCWAHAMLGTQLAQALGDCDEAVASDPKNAAFLDSRGWVDLRLGNDAKAVADFDRSIGVRPTASSLYGRGLAKTHLGDAAQGNADLAAARKTQPDIDATLARTGLASAATAPQ